MVRDNVTFRFRVDSAAAEETFRRLEAMARKFGGTVERTSDKVDKLKTNMGKLDQQSAASAVNFQTATQGALNLSTAVVQTYTSISNLDRANNRAKQSVIAVARAEDLLNNKMQRRNEMQAAGLTGGMKYANIQREIATAEADLQVKIEKRGIEQAAVNDIYMLFATNIANVTISSMQTIAILDKNQILLTKGKTIALKIQNAAIWSNIQATGVQIKSISALSITSKIGTAITYGFTGSIKAATVAVKAFAVAHPALIAVTAIMTGALIAYESNVLGIKDAINSLLPKQLAFQEHVDESRNSVGQLDENLEQLGSTIKVNFAKSLEDATSVALAFKMQVRGINEEVRTLNTKSITDFTTKVAEHHGLQTIDIQNQKKTKNFFDELVKSFTPVLTAFGEEQTAQLQRGTIFAPSKFDIPPPNVIDATFGLPEGTIEAGIKSGKFTLQQATDAYYAEKGRDPMQFLQQQELLKAQQQAKTLSPAVQQALKKVGEVVPLREQLQAIRTQQLVTDKRDPLVGQMRDTGVPQLDRRLFQLGLLKGEPAENIKKTLEHRLFPGVGGVSEDEFENVMLAKVLSQTSLNAVDFAGINNLQDKITQRQYTRLLAAQKGVGDSFMLTQSEQRIFEKIGKGEIEGNRAEVLIRTGIDVGQVANAISSEEALRIGHLQKLSNNMNGMSGGFTDSFLGTLTQQGKSYRKMQTEHALGGMKFGSGFFKSSGATAAYQVPRGSIATPKHIMTAIRNQDSFANGIGRYLENLTALLTGKKQKLQYRNNFDHRTLNFIGESRESINNALDFGFRANQDFVETLNQSLVDIDPQREGAVGRARQNVKTSVKLAEQFLKMQFGLLRGIGIESTTVSAIAGEVGLQGDLPTGFLNNLQVLSQMQRSDFNNYDIIHESKNKLNMTNQEVFAIRFDAKRGDDELLDRIRFQDRLEAMSSGTSAF